MKKETSLNSSTKMRLFRHVSVNRILIACFGISMIVSSGCGNDDESNANAPSAVSSVTGFNQVTLVADTAGYGAATIDTNLVNAWGLAQDPSGNWFVNAADKSLALEYNNSGVRQMPPIKMDSASPTGIVYNSTSSFVIHSTGQVSKYIFVGESGKIYAWSSGDSARLVVDRSAAEAVYKGATIASDGGSNFLYVANFKGGKVEVFDGSFNYITSKPFNDPTIPAGFAPFNVENINGKLYVTYAKQKAPDNEDDDKGPGNGYVNIFNPNGTLVKRFVSQADLNSPWGLAMAPSGFGKFKNAILVGNFGNGRINAYDTTGVFMGQLDQSGGFVNIDGLWSIVFPKNVSPSNSNTLYYTAGPKEENHGVFGYIKAQ